MVTFWETAPTKELIPNLRSYRERVLDAIASLATFFAAKMAAFAKQNAPWTDRTGAARSGLRAFVVKAATYVTLYLVTSVKYGLFLEVSHGGRFSILIPTMRKFQPEIMAAARRLVA